MVRSNISANLTLFAEMTKQQCGPCPNGGSALPLLSFSPLNREVEAERELGVGIHRNEILGYLAQRAVHAEVDIEAFRR